MDQLEELLVPLIPTWSKWILRKWPNHYLAYQLTGIRINFIKDSSRPETIIAEIWKNFKLINTLEYTKEIIITEIEGRKNKNKDNAVRLENKTG